MKYEIVRNLLRLTCGSQDVFFAGFSLVGISKDCSFELNLPSRLEEKVRFAILEL
jgi:hypothetical protein